MARSSNELYVIMTALQSDKVLEIYDVHFEVQLPRILLEFLESDHDLEEDEMILLFNNLGVSMYRAIKDNAPPPNTKLWNFK